MWLAPVASVYSFTSKWYCAGHLTSQCVSGIPIRTTLDNSTTLQYAGLIHQLTAKAKSTVRDIDPQVGHCFEFLHSI